MTLKSTACYLDVKLVRSYLLATSLLTTSRMHRSMMRSFELFDYRKGNAYLLLAPGWLRNFPKLQQDGATKKYM